MKEILRLRIHNGIYPRGSWLPTERALTTELNVSRAVLRSALADLAQQGVIVRSPGKRPWVNDGPESELSSSGERNGRAPVLMPIKETEEDLSATPIPESNRSLRRLGVVLPNRSVDLATRAILNGIHRALRLRETPYRLLTFDTEVSDDLALDRVELEREACTAIEHESVDGVIAWPLGGDKTAVEWRRMQDRGIPVVFVDRIPPGVAGDFVGVDNFAAGRDAVEYLLRKGHRRIAHVTSTEAALTVEERMRGYQAAMTAAGISVFPDLVLTVTRGAFTRLDEVITEFLSTVAPTAVFALNDHQAHRVVYAAETLGMVVGRDISVIGFDDIDRYSPRPALLTTMRQPFERIGECAVELLLQRSESNSRSAEKVFRQLYLATPLIERATCGPPAHKGATHHRPARGAEQ